MKNLFNGKKVGLIYLLSLVLLFSISFSSASIDTFEVTDVFEVNDAISYTKPCLNNGSYCSASAVCNYTFYDRDNSVRLNNVLATNIGSFGASSWQYNLTHEDTGLYKVDMVCVDGGAKGSTTLFYQVTGDGVNNSIGFYFLILGLSLGLIMFGFWIEDAWIVILGSMGLYFVGIYILMNGIGGFKDDVYTWAIGIIILMTAAYISIRSSMEVMVN